MVTVPRRRRRLRGERRLPPFRTLPPPAVARRPRCLTCRAPLVPHIRAYRSPDGLERWREWNGTYGDGEGFCGPSCAALFGRLVRRMLKEIPTTCPACGLSIAPPWPEARA